MGPAIEQRKCGPGANYCGWNGERYHCNTDGGSDPSGEFPKACLDVCHPSCWWKECGADGCGGDCGDCAAGSYCDDGVCVFEADPDVVNEDVCCDVDDSDTGASADVGQEGSESESPETSSGRRKRGCSVGEPEVADLLAWGFLFLGLLIGIRWSPREGV